jgi:hypothetical protein
LKVEQISIFVENKSGRLAEVTDILAKKRINIRALSLADTVDFGILRLIVNDIENEKNSKGQRLYGGSERGVAVSSRPSRWSCGSWSRKDINVEYVCFVQKSEETLS